MTYFVDASNQLWYFNDKITLLCKIDKIVDVFDTSYIHVVIDGTMFCALSDRLEIIEFDEYDQYDQPDEYNMNLIKAFNCGVKCCPVITENNEYTIILPSESCHGFDINCKTEINSQEYSICWIRSEVSIDSMREENKTKIKISFVKKSDVIKCSQIPIMEKIISYAEGYNQWGETTYKTDSKIIDSSNTYLNVDAQSYEHVMNEYIKTNNGDFVSLLNESKYDQIYPNLFEPICRIDDQYYINDICVTEQLYDFDFGQNMKSARS